MSAQATAWAKRQKAGSPAGKAVLLCIAEYAGSMGTAWETQAVLAEESEQSVDSVQRRQKELVARGILRKIRLRWHHGKVTSDYLILAISPLFGASIETIKEHLPNGAVPIRDSTDHAANCGMAENDDSQETESVIETGPPENQAADCGMDQAAGETKPCRTVAAPDESRLNQESPTQTLPRPEQPPQASEASPPREDSQPPPLDPHDSPEMRKLWSEFCSSYPKSIVNFHRTREAFMKLEIEKAKACVAGVIAYAEECDRFGQVPMAAHFFIEKESWLGVREKSKPAKAASNPKDRVLVPRIAGTRSTTAVEMLYRMTPIGVPLRCRSEDNADCYSIPHVLVPAVLAFADLKPKAKWEFYDLGTAHHLRWRQFVFDHTGKGLALANRGTRPGFLAPHPWPPRTDGTWSESPESPPSTGPPSPPQIPELTEDDIQVLTGTLG